MMMSEQRLLGKRIGRFGTNVVALRTHSGKEKIRASVTLACCAEILAICQEAMDDD